LKSCSKPIHEIILLETNLQTKREKKKAQMN